MQMYSEKLTGTFKESVSLHSQPKVKFKEYFEYFVMEKKSLKILHINNSEKLLTN